jgi:hypothetical protein
MPSLAVSLLLFAATAGCTNAQIPSPSGRSNDEPGALAAEAARDRGTSMSHPNNTPSGDRAAPSSANPRAPSTDTAKPVAVVELFTSEGCSSCPPADDLLRRIAAEERDAGRAVYLLSFHVDYWNDLGWPDPFSAQAYTERQHIYAQASGSSGVYTPQMIVGGRDAFVGSDAARARAGIERALAESPSAKVSLSARVPESSAHVDVTYAVASAPPGAVLNLALIERDLVVRVPRGENAGRTLHHENVVRSFRVVRLDGASQGSLTIPLPAAVKLPNAALVGYAQSPATLAILGATSTTLE